MVSKSPQDFTPHDWLQEKWLTSTRLIWQLSVFDLHCCIWCYRGWQLWDGGQTLLEDEGAYKAGQGQPWECIRGIASPILGEFSRKNDFFQRFNLLCTYLFHGFAFIIYYTYLTLSHMFCIIHVLCAFGHPSTRHSRQPRRLAWMSVKHQGPRMPCGEFLELSIPRCTTVGRIGADLLRSVTGCV